LGYPEEGLDVVSAGHVDLVDECLEEGLAFGVGPDRTLATYITIARLGIAA
jgi:hypothetical protein